MSTADTLPAQTLPLEEARLVESRTYPAPAGEWNVDASIYAAAEADPIAFWEDAARRLEWAEPWHTALEWEPPLTDPATGELSVPAARWFAGGRLNVAENCVDRHVRAGNGSKVALHFEGEPGDREAVTYEDLQRRVNQAANALEGLGIGPGDRVVVYLPVLVETIVIALACARIGAVHSLVFGGFSAEAVRFRLEDTCAKLLVTSDGQHRRGSAVEVKSAADEAARDLPHLEHVLVVRRTGLDIAWTEGRDVWWHEARESASTEHAPVPVEAEHPLFILYTSGTTGKPKGIVHTTGGYLTQAAYTHRNVFDLKPSTDVYWCTADVGWVTGHTYVVYGPMANRATQVIYEGTPDTPHQGRWWEIIEKHKVSLFYSSPTAIRTAMKWGEDIPAKFDLSSLRLLGSVGEAINPEAWMWYRRVIGGDRCPIVDTWWQTETGGIMISPLPGVTATKPGSAQQPVPGISADVRNDEGESVASGEGGYLVLDEPWPGMLRGIWGDPERFKETYWSRFEGMYFAGDGAKRDEDGDIWILGRVDDVMNVSGHRLSTMEIESALVSHDWVAEAAVVGANDETTGQAPVAFVILRSGNEDAIAADGGQEAVPEMLRAHVGREIGPIAKPKKVLVVSELPKTRSGKIMRRLLRDVAENREVGDTQTLADASVMDRIQQGISGAS